MTTRYFSRQWTIHFSHCDPAGIVFFPQYLVLFNNLVETWFTEGLGISYADMIAQRRVGLPTVHLECDFRRISRMGEQLDFCVAVKRLGSRSLTLQLWVGEQDQPRVRLSGRRWRPWHDALHGAPRPSATGHRSATRAGQ